MIRLVLILLTILHCLSAFSQSSKEIGYPPFSIITPKDHGGGGSNTIRSILQDSSGKIYANYHKGIMEFDGIRWHRHPIPETFSTLTGVNIVIGENGIIYTITDRTFGYFSPNEYGRLEYHSLKELLPKEVENYYLGSTIHFNEGKLYFRGYTINNTLGLDNSDKEPLFIFDTKKTQGYHYLSAKNI